MKPKKRWPKPIAMRPKAVCGACGHNDLTHNLLALVGETGCLACSCAGFVAECAGKAVR